MASFEAQGGNLFKDEWIVFDEEEPKEGDYYIACDLAGFADESKSSKSKKLDDSSFAIVKNKRARLVGERHHSWTLDC